MPRLSNLIDGNSMGCSSRYKQACRHQSRAPNALPAMQIHIFPLYKGFLDMFKKLDSIAIQRRDAAIDNWEGQEFNSVFPANVPFLLETQVFHFVRC